MTAPPPPSSSPPSSPPRARLRWAWWLLAYLSLGLGLVGIVVPGLPTVPFVLLSAYAAARGSRRLHARLMAHPQFGPMIRDWQSLGAVARRAKWLATVMMSGCAVILFLVAPQWWEAALGTGFMTVVATWLWLRPEPKPEARFDSMDDPGPHVGPSPPDAAGITDEASDEMP